MLADRAQAVAEVGLQGGLARLAAEILLGVVGEQPRGSVRICVYVYRPARCEPLPRGSRQTRSKDYVVKRRMPVFPPTQPTPRSPGAELSEAAIDAFLGDRDPAEVFHDQDLFMELRKKVAERALQAELAALTLNEVTLPGDDRHAFPLLAQPTPLQKEAFALLGVGLPKSVSSKVTGRKSSK